MTTPTVTITVGGVPITASTTSIPTDSGADASQTLYMMYVQAVKGETRYQWVVFPPAREDLGVEAANCSVNDPDALYLLSRTQRSKGNRSKWFHHRLYASSTPLTETVSAHAEQGYEVGAVVAVPLENDDYLEVWNNGETPHKALRAVDRALKLLGLSVK